MITVFKTPPRMSIQKMQHKCRKELKKAELFAVPLVASKSHMVKVRKWMRSALINCFKRVSKDSQASHFAINSNSLEGNF